MLEFILSLFAIAIGYVASIYTWPWLRTHATGAMAELQRLQDRAAKIQSTLKGE